MTELIAIQIATYHSSKDFSRVIKSIKDQTFTDWKVYVYENSCDAEEATRVKELLEQSGISFSLIVSEQNAGFSAHNHLFVTQEAKYTLVLNDDAYLDQAFLERLVTVMDADATIAAAAGMVFRWIGESDVVLNAETRIDTAGLHYDSLAHVVDRFSGVKWGDVSSQLQSVQQVWGVSGAVVLYRRSALLETALGVYIYDPTFFMYKEDVELAIRLARKGYCSLLVPDAQSFHRRAAKDPVRGLLARGIEERRRPERLRIMMVRNQWMIYVYHCSWQLGLRDLCASLLFELVHSAGVFVVSPLVFLKAWGRIFQSLPVALRVRRELMARRHLKRFFYVKPS
ncbi:glycosyltransferase [Patescibacteria group bacterium]|nr:glycosyltransferase [Patescibacteria group bacterium]